MDEQDEMKDSLSSMIKEGKIDDIKLATGIVNANLELMKNVWYNINDLITKDTIRYVELYCREGIHDKVYVIIENKEKNSNYRTIAYYGRRGKNLVKKDYGLSSYSNWELKEIMAKKLDKGYILINEFEK